MRNECFHSSLCFGLCAATSISIRMSSLPSRSTSIAVQHGSHTFIREYTNITSELKRNVYVRGRHSLQPKPTNPLSDSTLSMPRDSIARSLPFQNFAYFSISKMKKRQALSDSGSHRNALKRLTESILSKGLPT